MSNHVDELRVLLGQDVLLLGWPLGSKGTKKKWGHLTVNNMTPDYLAELATGNIGVALGHKSGNLISVDVDRDDGLTEFLKLNASIAETLISRGKRGGNVWFRMEGVYPRLQKLTRNGQEWGEWRADGGQTIIHGKHPAGADYQIVNRRPPLAARFAQIQWPADVTPPAFRTAVLDREDRADRVDGGGGSHLCLSASSVSPSLCLSVQSEDDAVRIALPERQHENNRHLFLLARAIKHLELRDGPFPGDRLIAVFGQWHQQASANGVLRPGQSRDEYLIEFLNAYRHAKFPLGANDLVVRAWAAAQEQPPPSEARLFRDEDICHFVALCAQMDRLADGKPWFLATRTAAALLNRPHSTMATWFTALVALGILKIAEKSTNTRAPRYRYGGTTGEAGQSNREENSGPSSGAGVMSAQRPALPVGT